MKNCKQLLAALLVLVMVVSMVPAAMADEQITLLSNGGGVYFNKKAVLEDDGTYTITIQAAGTGETTKVESTKPIDIVLVLDTSSSMGSRTTNYTARSNNTSYSYSSYGSNSYYYKDGDNFCKVIREDGRSGNNRYRLFYYDKSGTKQYLTGSSHTPNVSGVRGTSDEIYHGLLYSAANGSNTKMKALQDAAIAFIKEVADKNGPVNGHPEIVVNSRIAIVCYNDYANHVTNKEFWRADTNRDALIEKIENLPSGTYTNSAQAFEYAGACLDKAYEDSKTAHENNDVDYEYFYEDRDHVVIFFTDGVPTLTNGGSSRFNGTVAGNAVHNASDVKKAKEAYPGYKKDAQGNAITTVPGATVYAIGCFGTDTNNNDILPREQFMNNVSSNQSAYVTDYAAGGYNTSKGYYLQAGDNLETIFHSISQDISQPTVTLDKLAEVRDFMANGFKLTERSEAEAKAYVLTMTEDSDGTKTFIKHAVDNTVDPMPTANIDIANGKVVATNFDFQKYYVGGTADRADDGRLLELVIKGVVPDDDYILNGHTGVWIATNNKGNNISGIYGKRENSFYQAAALPIPQTLFVNKAVVIDYAKTVTADIDEIETVSYLRTAFDPINGSLEAITGANGAAKLTGGVISYDLNTMTPAGADSFRALGKTYDPDIIGYANGAHTASTATKTNNIWANVQFVAANNVYYEDTFIEGENDVLVGFTYSEGWQLSGDPNPNIGSTADEGVQGWVEGLNSEPGSYTDGTFVETILENSNGGRATASFTFTGTGFDVYGHTDKDNAIVLASIKYTEEKDGISKDKYLLKVIDTSSVNNYDPEIGKYYDVPAVFAYNLPYRKYTVTLALMPANNAANKVNYNIDGIRIYNPINEADTTDEVTKIYSQYESGAEFHSLRDWLVEYTEGFTGETKIEGGLIITDLPYMDDISVLDQDEAADDGIETFADDDAAALSFTAKDYAIYGPKNEVYLESGTMLAIPVTSSSQVRYALGIKALTRGVARVRFVYGSNKKTEIIPVGSTVDQYYEIEPLTVGDKSYIIVENCGEDIISLTKLKVYGVGGEYDRTPAPFEVASLNDIQDAYLTFLSLPEASYFGSIETTEAEEDEIIETQPEGGLEDFIINNPAELPEDYQAENNVSAWVGSLFEGVMSMFG